MKQHIYRTALQWTGNTGRGTAAYSAYSREFELRSAGKPVLAGSSDTAFRGDPTRYNPEELLVAALASCHMLWYLHLCATHHITVVDYSDTPIGWMDESSDGSGQFSRVLLCPAVTLAAGGDAGTATALHQQAHQLCYIARSVNFAIGIDPAVVLFATT